MNSISMQEWIARNNSTPGVLALGVYSPGKTSFVESCSPNFVPEALEKAWRAVTETISVLQLNRFPTARFRFVYAQVFVHCERRRDGACLGVFAQRMLSEAEMDRLVVEFQSI
jgi:hypothetical protein